MSKVIHKYKAWVDRMMNRLGLGMRAKLIIIFLVVKVIPLILLTILAWQQFINLGNILREIAVADSSEALNDSAIENIERMTTDTAMRVADFLYERDDDIRYLASIDQNPQNYADFAKAKTGRVMKNGTWALTEISVPQNDSAEPVKKFQWTQVDKKEIESAGGVSTNVENNDYGGFHYRPSEHFEYENRPLYDEITFIDLEGNEIEKYVSPISSKTRHPLSLLKRNVSQRENTYVKAETYWANLTALKPGEIYVSDVIGAYVPTNYIGMYTPEIVAKAAIDRGYDIPYDPENQAFAGKENPNGVKFEGIIRWATPVTDANGKITGYVTFALNHDHIMEFVDHITPMIDRYQDLPSAFDGNYAFIWDYKCRNIAHPRHHSIIGFNPETGVPEIPWLETTIYDEWQQSGVPLWTDYVKNIKEFNNQSRIKKPATALTQLGLVGLDGRYLNNAPQCVGWMDLTADGGSGSFYIKWSGLDKLTTAGAIPYYTGQYAPSEQNQYSRRGFGIVTIGAGLDDFKAPAIATSEKLDDAISHNMSDTFIKLFLTTALLVIMVVFVAIWMASSITGNITHLIKGISRFRRGERQFRFDAQLKDEFGTLADSFDDMANSIVDSVKNPLSITDMDENILYMNDQGLLFSQKTLGEVVGTSYEENSIYPVDSKYYPIKALHEGREAEIYFEPNSERYIRGSASYFLSKDSERIGYIIVTTDVTQMVLERNNIEQQRTLLDMIFSQSPDLIWYQDVDNRYMAINPRFASIAGKTVNEFIGKKADDILPPCVLSDFLENDDAALLSSEPLYTEEHITFADGHAEILDSVRTPIYDAKGTLVGLLGFARNVTARVTIESELRRTQLDLEQAVSDSNRANQHKGEFLARMSHEIRTPMNAIIGLTNIVQRKLNDAAAKPSELSDVRDHIRQIEVSSQHLLGLLNDILDLSKIEAGKIEMTDETMELSKLLSAVVSIIKPRCDEKNITFETKFEQFSPSAFMTDSLRLRQVLINLLGNAVKFTPELGMVTFSVQQLERKDGKALIEFTVSDTGIGISDESQLAIFQPFEQAGGKISQQYGGTGLGLSISRRIVQLFGGDIELKSAINEGSAFSFKIWLRESETQTGIDVSASDITDCFTDKRTLLVDDVEINRMIVMTLLEITGMQIDEAADGLEALEMFKQSPVGTYDMIFMDVQMPKMDGYESSSAIRALDRPDAKTIPIVALTANAFKEDINNALESGMNDHITKPVDMDRLVEVLLKFFGGNTI